MKEIRHTNGESEVETEGDVEMSLDMWEGQFNLDTGETVEALGRGLGLGASTQWEEESRVTCNTVSVPRDGNLVF